MDEKKLISWPKLRRICAHRMRGNCVNPERGKNDCKREVCPIWKKLEKKNA